MKIFKRIAAGALSAAVILGSAGPAAYGAQPSASIDEALYINMDYYGGITDLSIVKGVSLNGVKEFKDYGQYERVTNMSNRSEPEIDGEGVSFYLPEDASGRFYYECRLKDNSQVKLPWTFDISYKLNGAPVEASQLAGASGLVETTVKYTANDDADNYYRNNMLLQIASMVNMEEVISVEAPGSQLQSVGTYKAVVFMGLPGESGECVIRIGTESYESSGIVMMMIPGTLSQLEDIKEIKETKDKVQDSANAIHDSMNDIIGTLEDMRGGLSETREGLGRLDAARQYVSENKSEVYDSADDAIQAAREASEELEKLSVHFTNSQRFIDDFSGQMNSLIDTTQEFKGNLNSYESSIDAVQNDLNSIKDMLEELDSKSERRREIFEQLDEDLKNLSRSMDYMRVDSDHMYSYMNRLSDALTDMADSSSEIMNIVGTLIYSSGNEGLVDGMHSVQGQMADVLNKSETLMKTAANMSGSLQQLLNRLNVVMETGSETVDSLRSLMQLTGNYLTIIEDEKETADSLIDEFNSVGDKLKTTNDLIEKSLDEVKELNDILNGYTEDSKQLLTDFDSIVTSTNSAITTSLDFIVKFKDTARSAGELMDDGAQKSIVGLMDVLAGAVEGFTKTTNIRRANSEIKKALDKEIDRYEEETKLLEIDPDIAPVSFTSPQNPQPESIQIILRSEEISLDDPEAPIVDLEPGQESVSIGDRIGTVFRSIWEKIKAIFS